MLSSEYMVFEVQNPLRAKVGQEVIVSIPTEKELKAALIVYIIPLINFILGAIFGYYLNIFNNRDLSAIFISILFLVLTFLGIKLYSKKYEKTPFLKPAIKQVINGTNQEQIKI
jgi:positive regulator of sigma E activity